MECNRLGITQEPECGESCERRKGLGKRIHAKDVVAKLRVPAACRYVDGSANEGKGSMEDTFEPLFDWETAIFRCLSG